MDYKTFIASKQLRGFLAGIAVFIVLLVAFRAGMSVGFQKADFSYRFGDNYHRNIAGPKGGFRGGMEGRDYMNAHGLIGQIIKIDSGSLVIRSREGQEKIVAVTDQTSIARFRDSIKASDLRIDDLLVVIGEPDIRGVINAKLIRIMPPVQNSNMGLPVPPGFPMPRN